ncbi:hypothetical protein CCAX7_23540 [Capsulimonas corticalis]|uniref:Uncharacterized protein n=1 Tax=Capsulimonas corticalis TaxID=2219043 RepID=A0A402CV68_9BACT|nr:PilZ domain-containing protein [Capsulimonas corticalis]BDI30303.1 hypothetical protein CCAX7_23540 [Capsulimonas corticalis]
MNTLLPAGLRESDTGKRRFRRFKVAVPALAWPESAGLQPEKAQEHPAIAKSVFIENLSLTGLLIVSTTTFYQGTRLVVKFSLGDRHFALQVDIRRITETEVAGEQYFGYGAQFVRCQTIAEALPSIAAYLDMLSKAGATAKQQKDKAR